MVGTGKGDDEGVLFKNAAALEHACEAEYIVLDKTGTITEGVPVVTDILCEDDETAFLQAAASLEQASEHPLAEAIIRCAEDRGIELLPFEDFQTKEGAGVSARIGGREIFAGNALQMQQHSIQVNEEDYQSLADMGKTVLYFGSQGEMLGAIAVADPIKKDSPDAIAQLKKMGFHPVMVTGDNTRTAEAIRLECGIDRAIAQVMPAEKQKQVAALQAEGHQVMMVGDGVNDAPALTAARVGVAIGAGTDIAIESADAVLMKSSLMDLVHLIRLSFATMRTIRQNLFWAFFYNCIGIPLAAGVLYPAFGIRLSPMFGAFAMSMSSVFVVSNALRLNLFDSAKEKAYYHIHGKKAAAKKQKEIGTMKKVLHVEGMMCAHCQARVQKALSEVEGVTSCQVDLEAKTATCTMDKPVDDELLKKAVVDAGYEVTSIQ